MSLDTSYCAQAIRVANTPSHVMLKYPFEVWTDHDNLDLDMKSDVIVEHGAKKYMNRETMVYQVLSSVPC